MRWKEEDARKSGPLSKLFGVNGEEMSMATDARDEGDDVRTLVNTGARRRRRRWFGRLMKKLRWWKGMEAREQEDQATQSRLGWLLWSEENCLFALVKRCATAVRHD
ncbi:hypothetical protein TWF718_006388 [Orbilia javanica]|uniref:Uncharacterized protein n=1 Tax=Orbilia javanica TaxID=47235 RepID=A0AAN8N9L0_9PEZI